MALRINFNLAGVRSQLALANADRLMQGSLTRLSSGVRLHSAADDPAGLTIAGIMRHSLRGLAQATDNVENGVNMIQTAEAGMGEISALLLRARSLAVSGANEGAKDPSQLQALQAELDQILFSIDNLASNTRFGNLQLLDGSQAQNQLNTAAKPYITHIRQDYQQLPGGMRIGSTISVDNLSGPLARDSLSVGFGAGTPATTTIQGSIQNGVLLNAATGGSVLINGPKGSYQLDITATTTIGDLTALINATESLHGARAHYDATSGTFTIDSSHFGGGSLQVSASDMTSNALDSTGLFDSDTTDPEVNSFANPAPLRTLDYRYTDASGNPRSVTLTQTADSPGGLTFTNLDGGPEPLAPFSAYEPGAFQVRLVDRSDGSIGSTVDLPTTTFTALRQSRTDLQIGGESSQFIPVEIPDLHSGALGRVPALIAQGLHSLAALGELGAIANGRSQDALEIIDAAIAEVASGRGRLGALQSAALQSGLQSLRVARENLTAAESRIRDTDFAAESANYAKYNIQLQVATSMLAQANQTPQSVLQLLQ